MNNKEKILLDAIKIIAKRTNGGQTREAMVTRKIARYALEAYGKEATE